jgi:ADP-heptose:LPS heptosyltransferase
VTVLEQLPRRANILIVRLRSLGDSVLTTPAIRILRSALPSARISVIVEPRFAGVFLGNPDIDNVIAPAHRNALRVSADLTINLHGGSRSLVFTALSRAPFRAGFAHFRHGWVHNVKIPAAQEILGVTRKVHTAEHLASAMFFLGAPRQEIPRARLFASAPFSNPREYAVIHPMASAAAKTWPAERFLEVARHIDVHLGLEPVFIGGPGESLARFSPYRCLAGEPLEATKRLLSSASLFVGNDSGPAHMAAAFGIPVVVLFGASDPVVWAPWKTLAEQIVVPDGMTALPASTVIAAVGRIRVKA